MDKKCPICGNVTPEDLCPSCGMFTEEFSCPADLADYLYEGKIEE